MTDIDKITAVITSVVTCRKIYLFGSYAYGKPDAGSDFDFYVILPDDSERRLDVRRAINRKLISESISLPVDILANYESEFEKLRELPTLERKIAREGVLLYG